MIPFQRPPYLDDDAVRERVAANLDRLLEARDAGDRAERLHLLGQIGNDQRSLGNLLEAEMFLSEAVALARTLGDRRREAVNRIRLATARQYSGEHAEAEAIFREALALTLSGDAADYEDYALQDLGKCLVEMGRINEAIECFDRALVLRWMKADAELIASTEQALHDAAALITANHERP
jgi:HTH-type transcriptional regulator, pleiotropic regulator of extracellular virulence genes